MIMIRPGYINCLSANLDKSLNAFCKSVGFFNIAISIRDVMPSLLALQSMYLCSSINPLLENEAQNNLEMITIGMKITTTIMSYITSYQMMHIKYHIIHSA